MFFVIVILALLFFAFYLFNSTVENHSPWLQSFDGVQLSSEDFYSSCQTAIKRREIPGISFSRVKYSEGGVLSANREYLHVVRGEQVIDICAAPFGNGSFVSSWYVEKPDFTKKVLRKIPALAPLVGSRTYFQADTEAIFKRAVHDGVLAAVDELTAGKGVRLTEYERRYPEYAK